MPSNRRCTMTVPLAGRQRRFPSLELVPTASPFDRPVVVDLPRLFDNEDVLQRYSFDRHWPVKVTRTRRRLGKSPVQSVNASSPALVPHRGQFDRVHMRTFSWSRDRRMEDRGPTAGGDGGAQRRPRATTKAQPRSRQQGERKPFLLLQGLSRRGRSLSRWERGVVREQVALKGKKPGCWLGERHPRASTLESVRCATPPPGAAAAAQHPPPAPQAASCPRRPRWGSPPPAGR